MDFQEVLITTENTIKDYRELVDAGLIADTPDFTPGGSHYPLITKYPEIEYEKMFKGYKNPDDELFDMYIHFPFCVSQCIFCHYPSMYNAPDSEKDKYIDALEKELEIYRKILNTEKLKLRVILVGGGTPTDLTPKQLERFLKILTSKCDLSSLSQFNYDVSPTSLIGKVGIERLKIMKDYGVDRLTYGINSMHDDILKDMHRPHSKKEALEAINLSLDMGFQTNIEFIFGYPKQTLQSWWEDLTEIVQLNTHEIQFYRLKIDAYGDRQGTIKTVAKLHSDMLPKAEDTIRMKSMVYNYLPECGYNENLRKVFTKKKSYLSKYAYNQCCQYKDTIGLGLSAFSSLRDRFILNTPDFNTYYNSIANGKLPFNRGMIRDEITQQVWALVLPLKNYFLRKNEYKNITGVNIENTHMYPVINKLKEYNLVSEDDKTIKLTNKGVMFADEIAAVFYNSKYIPLDEKYYKNGPLNPYVLTNSLSKK